MASDRTMPDSIGIIGVGELACAIVDGLCDGSDDPPAVVLSPRGARNAADLARRHATVRVAADNQAVVDEASLVLISVRPEALDAALSGVSIAPDKLVVSAVAGVDHAGLHRRVGPDVEIVRAIPMPAVRRREGLTPTLPAHPLTTALFDRLGGTLEVSDIEQYDALAVVTGAVSSHLGYLAELARWAADHGLDRRQAESFVRSTFRAIGNGLGVGDRPLEQTVTDHETPGGLNEQLRREWFDPANAAALSAALDRLLARVASR